MVVREEAKNCAYSDAIRLVGSKLLNVFHAGRRFGKPGLQGDARIGRDRQ
jgi:hypothetical protein